MKFRRLALPGAIVIEPQRVEDERGSFARVWCRELFAANGITLQWVQASISHSRHAGTLRGMHFSWPQAAEAKLVRCLRGRTHHVLLDLRADSPAYLDHVAVDLDDEAEHAIFVPPGVAHGVLTRRDHCKVLYLMSDAYAPALSDGVRFDDRAFGIRWPLMPTVISLRDRTYPDFDPLAHAGRWRALQAQARPPQDAPAELA